MAWYQIFHEFINFFAKKKKLVFLLSVFIMFISYVFLKLSLLKLFFSFKIFVSHVYKIKSKNFAFQEERVYKKDLNLKDGLLVEVVLK